MSNLIIKTNKKFSDLTTFRIGGLIKYYCEVKNKDEVRQAANFAKKNNLKIFVLGGGSDFLASDADFDGLVIKYVGNKFSFKDANVTAEAGMEWDQLVKETIKRNLQGIECLSGIPGTVGAAPIQNIGAYGQELKDTFLKLTAFDIYNDRFVVFDKNDCRFGYRESIFKKKSHWQKFIITDITLKLSKDNKPKTVYESLEKLVDKNLTLKSVRKAVLTLRREKLEDPKNVGNAGSFFKNPVISGKIKERLEKKYPDLKFFPYKSKFKISAAWLIEKAGWKGKQYKGAGVSSKHALILINRSGNAKARDINDLADKIIKDVNKKFGIKLEREVQLINF